MKAQRKVGMGDLQHVRNNVLSVGIISRTCLSEQVRGSYEAGVLLNTMTRLQVLCAPAEQHSLELIALRYIHFDHQLLTYDLLRLTTTTYATLEIVLHLEPEEIVTCKQVKCAIIDAWNANGGRFTAGNFGHLDAVALTKIYLNANTF